MATTSDSTIGKTATAADLAERLAGLASAGRLAIFSDIDGTISPIAPQPDAAFVLPDAVDALARIAAAGVTVVLVTGRAAADARSMVGVAQLSYAGNHGFELLSDGRHLVRPDVEAAAHSIGEAVVEIEKLVSEAGLLGILFEDKRYTGSVHYRLAPNPDDARARLLPILRAVAEDRGLRLTEGRLVYEIRPSIVMNKGVFVTEFLAADPHSTAVFLGDDVTDVDGFGAIQTARASGALLSGLNVGVTAAESPQQVIDEADVVVAGTAEMAKALKLFADDLTEKRHA
jgi:trehalose 6-phosphate phosphatase